jgi:hypothetical protein
MNEDKELSHSDMVKMHNMISNAHEQVVMLTKEKKHSLVKNRIYVTLFIITAVLFIFYMIFNMVNNLSLSADEFVKKSLKYGLYNSPMEFELMKRETQEMISGINEVSRKYGQCNNDKLSDKQLGEYVSLLVFYKYKLGVDTLLFRSITATESEFYPEKISRTNGVPIAYGLNQVTKMTYNIVNHEGLLKYDRDDKIMDVYCNTEAAIFFLYNNQQKLKKFLNIDKVSSKLLSYSYNGGLFATYKAALAGDFERKLGDETLEYWDKVKFYYDNYSKKNYKVWYYEKAFTNYSKVTVQKKGDASNE